MIIVIKSTGLDTYRVRYIPGIHLLAMMIYTAQTAASCPIPIIYYHVRLHEGGPVGTFR